MKNEKLIYRTGIIGAWINIFGILMSSAIGVGLELLIQPSPPWQSPAVWAENYHPIQIMPYAGGFFMIFGFLLMMAVVHHLAEEEQKTCTLVALVLTGAFFGLIFLNYVIQTTFLPVLARQYNPQFDPIIFAFSLANPNSLSWGIEMWGYALLGIATWMAAPVFNRNGLEKTTAAIMAINGVVSLLGGILTSWNLAWVMTLPGLICYISWNVIVLALAVCFLLSLRQRMNELPA